MAHAEGERVRVVVAWAEPGRSLLLPVTVPAGSSLRDAVIASGLPARVALDADRLDLGVFGRRCEATQAARDGDRIEVYRPLRIDPKQARRVRARVKQRRAADATSRRSGR